MSLLPQSLDFNSWIEFCLNSNDPEVRETALEELSITGFSKNLESHLIQIVSEDSSDLARSLAKFALHVNETKLALKKKSNKVRLTPDLVFRMIESGDPLLDQTVIQGMRVTPGKIDLEEWREYLSSKLKKDSIALQIGISFLSKHGDKTDSEIVLKFLNSKISDVICAALTFLHKQDPETFKKHISIGLRSDDPKVQLHSIHLLRTVDSDECLNFLQSLLHSSSALIRQKCLRELMLIPFFKSSNLLMQFLAMEKNPLMLVKAGFVFAFNPRPEHPIRIYDILLLANGEKKHILNLVFKQNLEAIDKAGILDVPLKKYLESLKLNIGLRKSETIIRLAIKDLDSKQVDTRLSALERISKFSDHPSIQRILNKKLISDQNPKVRETISFLLEGEPKNGAAPNEFHQKDFDNVKTVSKFKNLSTEDQKAFISNIDSYTKFRKSRLFLHEILQKIDVKIAQIAILHKIGEFGSYLDMPLLDSFIHSEDSLVLSAAVKAIANFEGEKVIPTIERLIFHPDPIVKTAAIESLIIAEKEKAVKQILALIKSKNKNERRIGVSLLPKLDYSSAEPILWNLLKYEPSSEFKSQAAYLVATNPTPVGLKKLFSLCHKKDLTLKKNYQDLWQLALINAESAFNKPASKIEEECFGNSYGSHDNSANYSKPYSFQNIFGKESEEAIMETTDQQPSELGFFQRISAHFQKYRL